MTITASIFQYALSTQKVQIRVLVCRQKQSRSNADKMQYIFINGLAGFVVKWQPKPLTYENNYNVLENGKFVRAQ